MPIEPDLEAILDRPEGAAPEPEATIIEAPVEEETETDPDIPDVPPATPSDETPKEPVPWSEYEKLRHENAEYRKTWQPIEKAFDGVHPDDKAALLDLVSTYRDDPSAAAGIMRQYAEALAANGGEAVSEAETPEPQAQYLTAADLDRVLSEREQKRAATEAVAQIERDAVSMGYDSQSEDYVALLHIASKNGGDLKAADAALKAKVTKQVEAELAKLRDLAQVPTPQIGGSQPSGEREINTIKDAENALRESLGMQ